MMKKYFITKYNPAYRDEYGVYNKDEWNSIYDISKMLGGKVLGIEEYLSMENSYIFVVKSILEHNAIPGLTIMNLSKNHSVEDIQEIWSDLGIEVAQSEIELFNRITEGYYADIEESLGILRLILREGIECLLYSPKEHFVIDCNYDYNMYITCRSLSKELKQSIYNKKLYVEEYVSPE